MGICYRRMTRADIPAGMRLKDLAGWNQTPADWERFLAASPEGCFVAEEAGRVVGTSATIEYEGRFAWLGMVLVDPEFRRQGICLRLLDLALEHLDSRHLPTVKLDATPQGRPIYEQRGFVVEYAIERWSLERRPPPQSGAKGSDRSDFAAILKYDREAFGADRSWLLTSLDREAPELTHGYESEGRLLAYALGRRGSRADHLGPWAAKEETVAGLVLDEFLRRSARKTVFVDMVKSNPFAERLLGSRGFAFSRPLTRMFRGPNTYPGRKRLLCAVLGPEFG